MQVAILETVAEVKLWRSVRTMQCEDRLVAASDHVDVGRPVIVWIDDHAQTIEPVHSRHTLV